MYVHFYRAACGSICSISISGIVFHAVNRWSVYVIGNVFSKRDICM